MFSQLNIYRFMLLNYFMQSSKKIDRYIEIISITLKIYIFILFKIMY